MVPSALVKLPAHMIELRQSDMSEASPDTPAASEADLSPTRVLVIDADPKSGARVADLVRAGWVGGRVDLVRAGSVREAVVELREGVTDCVLLDVEAAESGLELLRELLTSDPAPPVIVLADEERDGDSLAAIRAGASDQQPKAGLSAEQLRRCILHAIERRRAQMTLAHRALHDDLTGLPNRSLFLDRLSIALGRLRRTGGRVSVLFIDLDGFKEVNDSLGHAAGDQVLRTVAGRLRKMLRPSDTVARFGGDEFTFLFEGVDTPRDVLALSERIAGVTSEPIVLEGTELVTHASIGIATVTDPDTPPEIVLREADSAMYRAKQLRRGDTAAPEVVLMDRPPAMPGSAEHELQEAIERHEIQVHYQPKVSLHEREGVSGLEALVRWMHPRRGLVGPSELIPLAEQTGLIVPLGRYVIDDALERLSQWQALCPGITISVNLSPSQLADEGLAPTVAAAIDRAAVEPGALSLEVPERAFAACPDAGEAIGALKALGVRVSIDDYGTGASSLASLRHLPLDELKIDGSFVSALDDPSNTDGVVRAVVELGHALGLRVVAEGVETESQLAELQSLGCDDAQGYFFSRPVPAEQVGALLAA